MQVEKGRKITQIGGDDWDRFIARMRLSRGELISFSFRKDRPRISVIYLNLIPDSEDEVHEEEDGADSDDDDSDDDENPLVEYLYAQGLRLGDEEIGNLWDMLPLREDYLGKPFVTRLTRTNVKRHIMLWHRPGRRRHGCWTTPYQNRLHHQLCLCSGHGRSHCLEQGRVEEVPSCQESSGRTGHPTHCCEHPSP
ncbi:hypothetical protein ACQJBY_020097 [Aegilops geniculata]